MTNSPNADSSGQQRAVAVPALRRVLVTTDFSPASERALAYALAVAWPDGIVRLVHVVHPRALPRGEFETGPMSTPGHADYVRAIERQLDGLLPRDAPGRSVQAEARVVEAENVARGICDEADRFDADVIVIASRGLSGVQRIVLGSVAQAVMTHSTRPVFVARLPAE